MSAEITFYVTAIAAVLITGISKGGFANGIAMLGTPLLALSVPPLKAAAIMLPVLLVMDLISLYSYRGHTRWSVVRHMLPGGFLGLALGWATAVWVSDSAIRIVVGAIAIAFVVSRIVADWRKTAAQPESPVRATFWSTIAGYTSFVAHAGGPPYQAYTLPLRLEKIEFAGTSVIFFAVMNFAKIIPYLALGQFDTSVLVTSATLIPVAVAGVLIGVWAVRRVSEDVFYRITYVAMIVVGSKLIWDGVVALL